MANVITLEGGDIVVSAILDGGDIYPSGGGGGGLLQTKSVSYTPTESAQTDAVTADPGYDGLEEVDVTIGAISSTYVGSGVTRQAAQIIHPSTSDQSIPSGTYLTGAQGFKAVTTTNLTSGNIKNGVTVKVGDSSDDDRIISVTGTYSGGGANLESKSVSYTPTETAITALVTPSTGYDGLSQVDVTVDAISSSYVGSAVTRRDSSDLSASGATVTAPSGYYASSATKTISNASTPYGGISSIDSSGNVTIDFEIDYGGYIGAGTYTVMDTMSVQSAQTIYPSASDQSIASGKYLTGAQTIKGVTYSGLDAGNIKKDVVVKIGDSSDDDRIVSVTGTYEGGGGGISVDGMASGSEPSGDVILNTATSIRERAFNDCTNITSIHAKDVTSLGQYIVNSCTSLTTFVSESQTTGAYNVFSGARQLTAIDINHKGSPSNNFFQNCESLTTLVLRRTDAITALGSTGAFNGTPFRSGGSGGTIYVPQALLSTYPTASNWSTINGYGTVIWKSIESTHTDPTAPIDLTLYYADGTAIS